MKNILLIGGAGYVGTAIAEYFVDKSWTVNILDNFIYGHEIASHGLLGRKGLTFFRESLCTDSGQKTAVDLACNADVIVILAGLVGDPITKKYPKQSEDINVTALKNFISSTSNKGLRSHQNLIFISTCSNYGLMTEGQLADEESALNPLSLYAEAKVEIEYYVSNAFQKSAAPATILRFATAFGISARMRFDLTVNQFTRAIALGENLLVFDPDTWRPYCHVNDFARLIETVHKAPQSDIDGQIFNAGGYKNNFTKRGLVSLLSEKLDCSKVTFKDHGEDPRNYRVNFDKVKSKLGFEPEFSVADGVDEVIKAVSTGFFCSEVDGDNLFGNYYLNG